MASQTWCRFEGRGWKRQNVHINVILKTGRFHAEGSGSHAYRKKQLWVTGQVLESAAVLTAMGYFCFGIHSAHFKALLSEIFKLKIKHVEQSKETQLCLFL